MAKQYVITLTAANRVGILAALTTAMAELGGDLQEVSVTVMRKFFTIIVAADFPEDREPRVIIDHIRDIGRPFGIEVCLKDPAREILQDEPRPGVAVHFLTVTGHNQPGLMRLVSSRLAQDGIDIADLYAWRNEENGGSFDMVLELLVPPDVEIAAVEKELEARGAAAGLSVRIWTEEMFAGGVPRPARMARQSPRAGNDT